MGRLIFLDTNENTFGEWLVPRGMQGTWPNDLFPHDLSIPDHPIQGIGKVMIRRCIEQECQGDAAIERCYSPSTLAWKLWFQVSSDRDLVFDRVISLAKQKDPT